MYQDFFNYAQERQLVNIKKTTNKPRPWTEDAIIGHYKFCNIFREDDRTTIWFKDNVRERYRDRPEVLLATILFRWFNRMTTGEALFCQLDLEKNATSWEIFLLSEDISELKSAILRGCGKGPYVTGAYCIIGAPHMPKLDGILKCFENVVTGSMGSLIQDIVPGKLTYGWRELAETLLARRGEISLEAVWDWLRRFPRSGDFMAYEVVTDLMFTDLLDKAPDIMTWANAGPGAIRGLNRIHDRPLNQNHPKRKTNEEMQAVLAASFDSGNWGFRRFDHAPGEGQKFWPAWDMRTVEHTLCEFDKYERIRLGQGKVKGVYK